MRIMDMVGEGNELPNVSRIPILLVFSLLLNSSVSNRLAHGWYRDHVEACKLQNSVSKTKVQASFQLGPAKGSINGKLEDGKRGQWLFFFFSLFPVVLRQQLQSPFRVQFFSSSIGSRVPIQLWLCSFNRSSTTSVPLKFVPQDGLGVRLHPHL